MYEPSNEVARRPLPISTLFSAEVRETLIRASNTPGEFDRSTAIDLATEFARGRHPELFK